MVWISNYTFQFDENSFILCFQCEYMEEIMSRPNSPWQEKLFSSISQGDSFQCSPFLRQDVSIKNIGNPFKRSCCVLKVKSHYVTDPSSSDTLRRDTAFTDLSLGLNLAPSVSLSAAGPSPLISAASSSQPGCTISEIGPIWLTSRIREGRARGRNAGGPA